MNDKGHVPVSGKNAGSKKINVLIVDDDKDVAYVVMETIRWEYKDTVVDVAYDCLIAKEKIALKNPDLLIVDIFLPGTDGFNMLKEIMPVNGMKIIAITSNISMEARFKILAYGVDDLIVKPFSEKTLLETVKKVLI